MRLLIATPLCIAVLVITVTLSGLSATREPVINRSNYNKIQLGMSESAVDELLQGTSVDLAPLNFEDVTFEETALALLLVYPPPHTSRSWKGDRYMISVIIDKHGRVAAKYYKRAPDASMIDRCADWLGF